MTAHEAFRRALEEAAKVCESIAQRHWREYKAGAMRGDSRIVGKSDGAEDCLDAIRAIPNPYPAPTQPEEKA